MQEIKNPVELRYPEGRTRLSEGGYVLKISDDAYLGYRRDRFDPEWFIAWPGSNGQRQRQVYSKADDYWPPDGIHIKDYHQALACVFDHIDGVAPGCVSRNSRQGYPRREFPKELLLATWEVAGTLTAAEALGGGGWGFTWANPEGMRQRGLAAWPNYVHLINIPGRESVARLAGKVIRLFAGGESLNSRDHSAMKAALEARGFNFTDDEYRGARAALTDRFYQVRAVYRKAIRQMRLPPHSPGGEQKYTIWSLLKSEPRPLPAEYREAATYGHPIFATLSKAPSLHYPLPQDIGPHAPLHLNGRTTASAVK